MPRSLRLIVLEEWHVTVRVPPRLDRRAVARLRKRLASGDVGRALHRAVRAVLGFGTAAGVRVSVSH